MLGDELVRWTPKGYAERAQRPVGDTATVVTAPSLLEFVRRRESKPLVPFLHPSAY